MESEIIINGTKLTAGQAMTVRVALESFYCELLERGLGDDETAKRIVAGYVVNIREIRKM